MNKASPADNLAFLRSSKKKTKILRSGMHSSVLNVRGGGASSVDDFLNAIDLFGTAVFAFSGALTAGTKGMDIFGMTIVATVTAVGGGTVRDWILDCGPVFWIQKPIFIQISFFVTLFTFYVWPTLEQRFGWKDSHLAICTADAFGLGAFSVLGTQKPIGMDLKNPLAWVLSGLISSCFGGITRDVLCSQKPRVLYPDRTLYATPPLLGSISYTLLNLYSQLNTETVASIAFLVTFLFRVLCFGNPIRMP
eukprot:CAMPEP_0194262130 /NCGR_PEP_ID=MMETSP0158-20130606/46388_1 /TAXON_ID=33649 /ORGANISM="Thalassionema nitzschioides, Strain L26-B" /LENGTH=249 /DNA_ID=CAMNT_0039002279 /DNA_START=72 /DNA_END=817 /DNA_ORIENTATION=+